MRYLIVISVLFYSFFSFASFQTIKVDNFFDVVKTIKLYTENALQNEVLIVFDLDETLVITEDCPEVNPESTGLARFEEKIMKCNAWLTSPNADKLINTLKHNRYYVMALTARGFKVINHTIDQLENRLYNSPGENRTSIIFNTAPNYFDTEIFLPFSENGKPKQKLAVKKGVVFASGADKGPALLFFLNSLQPQFNFTKVIFVDDNRSNIRSLEKTFATTPGQAILIHYTEHAK